MYTSKFIYVSANFSPFICGDSAKSNVNFVFLNPEFQKIAMATAIGFAIMGFIGFFVKLIHIPINNIIV